MKKIAFFILILLYSCSKDNNEVNETNSDYYNDGDIEVIFENDSENGINVIFMGDRYTRNELKKEDGRYITHAIENIEYFFNAQPFSQYQEHFNAYIIFAESEITISNGSVTNYTPFGSTLISLSGSNNLKPIIQNLDAVNDYVHKIKGRNRTQKDIILMSVNAVNGGTATFHSNLAVFGDGKPGTMLHEVGHAFGGLADEYYRTYYTGPAYTEGRPNVDATNDLQNIKWKHFIGLPGYDNVGAYEGGALLQYNVWRPEHTSIMRGNIGPFNAPSREAIVKKILSLRGLEYNFEEFLANDVISLNRSSNPNPILDEAINCLN